MKRSTLICTSVLLSALLAMPAFAQFTMTTLHSPTPFQEGEFGAAVAGIGDINGDGAPGVVVGAFVPAYSGPIEPNNMHRRIAVQIEAILHEHLLSWPTFS